MEYVIDTQIMDLMLSIISPEVRYVIVKVSQINRESHDVFCSACRALAVWIWKNKVHISQRKASSFFFAKNIFVLFSKPFEEFHLEIAF